MNRFMHFIQENILNKIKTLEDQERVQLDSTKWQQLLTKSNNAEFSKTILIFFHPLSASNFLRQIFFRFEIFYNVNTNSYHNWYTGSNTNLKYRIFPQPRVRTDFSRYTAQSPDKFTKHPKLSHFSGFKNEMRDFFKHENKK